MAQITDIVNQLDDVTASFNDVVDSAQKRMLNQVITLMKDLSIKDGRISPTVENLKIVNAIRGKLSKLVLDKKYMYGLNKLLKSFSDVQGEQIDYFKAQFGSKNLSGKYGLTLQMSIDNTAQALSGSGINANVVDRLKSMLVRSVVSGGQFSDLVGQVREYLTDTPTSAGALSRYAKTYATTALSQFTGETNKLLTDDFKPEWYRYVGSNKETTREWCEHMTEKEWVHISEFEQIIDGKIDGKEVEIYKKTGLPRGMIEGTNTENLLVNRGGWGCQHQFYAVDERIVPENIKAKFNGVQQSAKTATERNIENVEKSIGIKQGDLMDFEKANQGLGNVNFKKDFGYTINCQSCVVANELRRRGFDVTAKTNTQKRGNIPYELSKNTERAWIDPQTNTYPTKTIIGRGAQSRTEFSKGIAEFTKEPGRYNIDFAWNRTRSGHIITIEKTIDGKYKFYDPQSGQKINWAEYNKCISKKYGIRILRVDDKLINTEIINGIVSPL